MFTCNDMRVLHLSSEKHLRGGERQIILLVTELKKQGVSSWIACRTGSSFSQYCRENNWPFIELPFRNSFDIKSIWRLNNFYKIQEIDIVHIHSGKSHSIAVLSTFVGNKARLILSRRVFYPIKKNWFTKWKYNHSSIERVISISRAVQTQVLKILKDPNRSTVIYSGIDINRFKHPSGLLRQKYALTSDAIIIGVTAAIEPAKDLKVFVDTAALVLSKTPNSTFFIIGDGPEGNTIQQYIDEKGLSKKVHITGFLHNVEEVLPELDIFLMTSQTEGLGTSILDAFACRIPVVATRAGGILEMVKHGETGMLASIKDSANLAQHVLYLLNNPSVKDKITQQAYELLIQKFTHSVMAQHTLEVYREVLST